MARAWQDRSPVCHACALKNVLHPLIYRPHCSRSFVQNSVVQRCLAYAQAKDIFSKLLLQRAGKPTSLLGHQTARHSLLGCVSVLGKWYPKWHLMGKTKPLDCYWVGSLDFSFLGNQGPKKLNFSQGGQQQPRIWATPEPQLACADCFLACQALARGEAGGVGAAAVVRGPAQAMWGFWGPAFCFCGLGWLAWGTSPWGLGNEAGDGFMGNKGWFMGYFLSDQQVSTYCSNNLLLSSLSRKKLRSGCWEVDPRGWRRSEEGSLTPTRTRYE